MRGAGCGGRRVQGTYRPSTPARPCFTLPHDRVPCPEPEKPLTRKGLRECERVEGLVAHGDISALSQSRRDTTHRSPLFSPLTGRHGRQAHLSKRLPHPYRYRLGLWVSSSKGMVRNQL